MTSFNDSSAGIARSWHHSGGFVSDSVFLRSRAACREAARFPYVPGDPKLRDERCFEVYNIQVAGLEQRLRATGIRKLVIGVSGGLIRRRRDRRLPDDGSSGSATAKRSRPTRCRGLPRAKRPNQARGD